MRHNNVMCVVDFYKTTIKDLMFAFVHVCKWELKEFYARGVYKVWFEDKGNGHIQAIYEGQPFINARYDFAESCKTSYNFLKRTKGASASCVNGEIVIDSSHDYEY